MQCLQKNEESSGKTHSDYLLKMWAMFASLFEHDSIVSAMFIYVTYDICLAGIWPHYGAQCTLK